MMMRLAKYLLMFSITVLVSCDSDNNIDNPDEKFFGKIYGTDGDQIAVDMEMLNDGSILLLGSSLTDNVTRPYLVKVNAKGEVLWQKKYGDAQDQPVDLEAGLNGNFAIATTFLNSSAGTPNKDVKIILINGDGTKLDSAISGSTVANDFTTSVTSLADGGFIITANTEEVLNGPTNTSRFRCDSNLDWLPNYDTSDGSVNDYDYILKTFEIDAGTYYAFGTSERDHAVTPRLLNMQYFLFTNTGSPNTPAYTGSFSVETKMVSVTRTPSEFGRNFAILGTEFTNGAPIGLRVSILRSPLTFFPNREDELFNVSIATGQLTGVSISSALASPSGYLILANESGNLGSNIWLTKIDQSGSILWTVRLGSENEEDLGSVVRELPDGRILVLGTIGVGDKQSKMALFKLNSNGRLQE